MSDKKTAPMSEKMFSDVVGSIFRHNGYTCHSHSQAGESQQRKKAFEPDWIFEKGNHRYIAEVVFSRNCVFPENTILRIAMQVRDSLSSSADRPMLVVGGVLESGMREHLLAKGILTIDVPNLLYMARSDQMLLDQLTAAIPCSIGDVKPVKPGLSDENGSGKSQNRGYRNTNAYGIDFGNGYAHAVSGRDTAIAPGAEESYRQLTESCEALQKILRDWVGGKETSSGDYEKLCTQTLRRLFADDLTLWNEQAKSNGDLYRFDLICKVKRDNHKDFWEMAERYFDSKYIIFEFKNYSKLVTQKEVYTTLRYLYATALRRVAIIVSPNGIDEHADKAIRGALRDEGKLILTLTNGELIRLLEMKMTGKDPADFLSDKLDELLIDLEK